MATKIDNYRWEADDGTEFQLTDIPTDPCHECGADIPDDEYCYFRDRPGDSLDHVCWSCGRKVTGFGEPANE